MLAAGSSIGLLFYDRIGVALLCSALLLGFFPLYRRHVQSRRQEALLLQFRDVLYALSSAVSAGRPMTEGLAEAQSFCRSTYDEKDDMMQELSYMLKRMQQGGEDELPVLRDFAMRSGLADIADFVNVYEICRASGGDLARANLIDIDKIRNVRQPASHGKVAQDRQLPSSALLHTLEHLGQAFASYHLFSS